MQKTIKLHRPSKEADFSDTKSKINFCLEALREEFTQPHDTPWIICFSGGKDSTLLLQMVFEVLEKVKNGKFGREVHIVSNDTLVESPLVARHLDKNLAALRKYIVQKGWQEKVKVQKTRPKPHQTFWVNLIGKGYASPTPQFRWCTRRLKIDPSTNYIKEQVNENGKVIVLLGVRKEESSARAAKAAKYGVKNSRLHPHPSLKNCMVFRPILDLTHEELWSVLLQRRPPWGDSHRQLITLYRNALGGECPIITDVSEAPSCGSTSPRFGCWTCTVIKKDKSLEGLVDAGFDKFEPLVDFRNYLMEMRGRKIKRMKRRRNGTVLTKKDGSVLRSGPFTIRARKEILEKLEQVEEEMGGVRRLISEKEKMVIKKIWESDIRQYARRGRLAVRQRGAI